MPTHRFVLVHRIEGGDFVNGDGRHVEIIGNLVHQLTGQVSAVHVLHEHQRRHTGRLLPTFGILGDPGVNLLAHLGVNSWSLFSALLTRAIGSLRILIDRFPRIRYPWCR